ncbi:hypothetical protein CEUSTIGMA_g4215.t1 [Chlamydomonas eustigma]|uniref:EGF-like domain-containing protein n=1 Tax=Chlamydomonas eustigma TaxID=1157962 RepID=A0A250X118_9CHLO|nr:hypothetical protein CEUSTIGMA_g4215.t1 [Chlamydomonas eustigma]|eukprot:GAX76768.1 hypothetical protein CEUSTIGMA_g4215.t1 [Chlamydomonas eustigma]
MVNETAEDRLRIAVFTVSLSHKSYYVVNLIFALLTLSWAGVSARKSCPDECTKYGTCNEELGRCDCPWNYTGLSCSTPHDGFCLRRVEVNTCTDGHPTLCVNACNARGDCKGGFCHCKEGFFGTDCSLSYDKSGSEIKILDRLGYRQNKRGPLIYVYELPPEYHVKRDIHKVDRPPLHLAILERLLTGGHRTTEGSKADFFYVPITSRDLKKAFLLMPVLQYISSQWPFWNATGGSRHIIPMEGDVGTCELPLLVRKFTPNITWLQFWGMHDYHPSWEHIFHNRIPCFVAGRDIVVPFMAMSSHDRFVIQTPLRPGSEQPERNTTFFFAGGICGSGRYSDVPPDCKHYKQERYSGGVRQAVYEHFHERPGWKVVTKTKDYAQDYASSNFCLAAPGGGWGKRGIVATMNGCIPVVATDMLFEAFEPEMDWGHFGVRVSQSNISSLGDLLDTYPLDELKEKQARLPCAAQHFHWSGNLGGIMKETGEFDAFNTIMAILRMRRKYPQARPEEFYSLDKEFRDFVDCKPLRADDKGQSLCTMYIGPGMLKDDRYPDACPPALYYMRRKIGPPGGALCINATNLAHCRERHWRV